MKHYIVYSSGGTAQDPNGEDVENCQVVALLDAEDMKSAKEQFMETYEYQLWEDDICTIVEAAKEEYI